MGKLIQAIGLITVLASFAFLAVAKSAFHETTVAVLWCGGWLIYASGVVASRLNSEFTVVPAARPVREDLDNFRDR